MTTKNGLFFLLVVITIVLTTLSTKRHEFTYQNLNKPIEDSIKKYMYNDPEKAIFFLHKFIKQTKKKEDILKGYGALSVAHKMKNNIDSTLFFLNKGLVLSEKPSDIIAFKYDIGKTYEEQYNYEYALLLYKQCYDLVKKEKLIEEYDKIEHSLALMENKIGKPEKALILLKAMYTREVNQKEKVKNLKFTRKNLAETYLNSKKPDSALKIINEGLVTAKQEKNNEFQYHFYKLKAESLLQKKEYTQAFLESKQALTKATVLNNTKFKDEASYLSALANIGKDSFKVSIATLIDIIDNKSSKSPEELSKYYKALATSYDAIGNSELSVKYYKKFTNEEKKVTEKRLKTLDNIYDIDLSEKIIEKQKQKDKTKFWLVAFIFLGVFGLLFIIWLKIEQKKNQRLFEALMVKVDNYEKNKEVDSELNTSAHLTEVANKKQGVEDEEAQELITKTNKPKNSVIKDSESNAYIIDDDKIQEILSKVKQLEDKKYYLKQECTMHNMAKRLKTNTSYLSKIINNHLNKTFSSYINELRIDYVILELKNNKRLRSYSVKAISEEIGYKSADSFAKYFKEATGLTPSVYIKKISNITR